MKNQINAPPTASHPAKKMYVPQEMLLSMGGVMKAMTKLLRMGQYLWQAAMIAFVRLTSSSSSWR
jgi:hypothetical protein